MSAKLFWIMGLAITLTAVVLAPRVFDLGQFMTADEKRWLANTNGFVTHLAHGEWGNLLQQPHPGLTTQWFGASTIYSPSLGIQKLPLVVSQTILVLLAGYVARQLWGKTAGILAVLLLGLNPLLVAHTRVYAMDSFLALFCTLSLLLLLLGQKTAQVRYASLAGAAAAAATLSKLPGVILLPFTLLVFVWWYWQHPAVRPTLWRQALGWLAAAGIAALLLLPSLLVNFTNVMQEFASFFSSDDYQELHQAGRWYYARTVIFFSAPVHLALLLLLPLWWSHRHDNKERFTSHQLGILLLFVALFILQMTIGLKKGDRYLLPVFTTLDVIAAAGGASVLRWYRRKPLATVAALLLVVSIVAQGAILARLHPYSLAYVNPLFKPWFGERRLGWGEGLDLAADYLNAKADSTALKVAAYYPAEFGRYFRGEVVPVHQHDHESVDYVVLYRAMYERGSETWETDVLNQYRPLSPEKIITLNGLPYVWIYRQENSRDRREEELEPEANTD